MCELWGGDHRKREICFFSQEAHGILDGDCLKKARPREARTARRISRGSTLYHAVHCSSPMTKLYSFTVTDEVLWELERHIQPLCGREYG
ncbi:MAG: hypothetical protein ACLU6Y_06435 [Ruminococcus sp.]